MNPIKFKPSNPDRVRNKTKRQRKTGRKSQFNLLKRNKTLSGLAVAVFCLAVVSCGVFQKNDPQKETSQKSAHERLEYIEIKKISDPITPEGMEPIEYNGKMVKQDDSMYPEFVDSLKNELIMKASKTSYFKGEYLDSIPAIIQKVFPKVYFLKAESGTIRSSITEGIAAYYNEKYVGCVWEFNDLYFRMNHQTDVLLNEKLLAIFVIRNNMDKNLYIKISGITPITERQIENTRFKINYKFNVDISGESSHEEPFYDIKKDARTWYFYDKRGMILYMGYFKGNYYNKIMISPLSSSF